jgi:Domain of unknown function (DUF6896)
MALSKPEFFFLEAAAELTSRQFELLPLLERALGRTAFDYWIRGDGKGDPALDSIEATTDGQWHFHFHGLEVDVRHAVDGRAVRIDFGSGGTPAFTPGGVGAFAFASRPPWRAFFELRAALEGSVDYDHARCVALSDQLRYQGLIEYVAPEVVALIARYSRFDPERGHIVDIPKELRPEDENTLTLCDRLIITDEGRALLARAG